MTKMVPENSHPQKAAAAARGKATAAAPIWRGTTEIARPSRRGMTPSRRRPIWAFAANLAVTAARKIEPFQATSASARPEATSEPTRKISEPKMKPRPIRA